MLCLRRNSGSDACYDVTLESENGDIGTLGIIATPGKLPLNAPLEGKSVTLSGVDLGATWSDQASEVQLQLADGSGDLTLAKSSPGDVDAFYSLRHRTDTLHNTVIRSDSPQFDATADLPLLLYADIDIALPAEESETDAGVTEEIELDAGVAEEIDAGPGPSLTGTLYAMRTEVTSVDDDGGVSQTGPQWRIFFVQNDDGDFIETLTNPGDFHVDDFVFGTRRLWDKRVNWMIKVGTERTPITKEVLSSQSFSIAIVRTHPTQTSTSVT